VSIDIKSPLSSARSKNTAVAYRRKFANPILIQNQHIAFFANNIASVLCVKVSSPLHGLPLII